MQAVRSSALEARTLTCVAFSLHFFPRNFEQKKDYFSLLEFTNASETL